MTYRDALAAFLATGGEGWAQLPFFRSGAAERLAGTVDARAEAGEAVLPPAADMLAAFAMTPLDAVKVVILGQDPYPTPGDAHGLAFSYRGGRRLPASLRNIYKELAADLATPPPAGGDLAGWARQGVLLLNTALTVAAGQAGAHAKLGWETLADEALREVSRTRPHAVFILWGAKAMARRPMIDETRHLVIASAHPSPLSARTGFFGSRPFSRANAWLEDKGMTGIGWT